MRNKKLFEIATLSDHVGWIDDHQNYNNLSEPIAIITGGVAILQSIFPNLFGGGRRVLTTQDWTQMFPGNGAWTVRLRNYLANTIHYDADLTNISPFTRNFVFDNKVALCGVGVPFNNCFQTFLQIIEQEKFSGGTFPVGQIPGIAGAFNYQAFLPWVIGGLALVLVVRAGGRRRRK